MTFVQTKRDSDRARKVEKRPDLGRTDTLIADPHYSYTKKGKPLSANGTFGLYIATTTLVKVKDGGSSLRHMIYPQWSKRFG